METYIGFFFTDVFLFCGAKFFFCSLFCDSILILHLEETRPTIGPGLTNWNLPKTENKRMQDPTTTLMTNEGSTGCYNSIYILLFLK
jgi:hypothetical protein